MAPRLGYWKVRGMVQPIRYVLAYTGAEYTEELYELGSAPEYDRSTWTDVKENLGLDFPNLPYYIDGDIKLTQSDAILRHLARKYKLDGSTEEEKVRVDLLHHEIVDRRLDFRNASYSSNFEDARNDYLKELPQHLRQLSAFLGSQPYFTGNSVTFADFMAYEWLIRNQVMQSECLDHLSNLLYFIERIEALPQIAEYLKSAPSAKYPIHNKHANFGGNITISSRDAV